MEAEVEGGRRKGEKKGEKRKKKVHEQPFYIYISVKRWISSGGVTPQFKDTTDCRSKRERKRKRKREEKEKEHSGASRNIALRHPSALLRCD